MALRLRTEPEWVTFLIAANISEEASSVYAKKLVDNHFTETSLSLLTSEHLRALDITILGDTLAILGHVKSVLSPPSSLRPADSTTTTTPSFKPPTAAIKLPTITCNMTHPQFRKFTIDWNVYKQIIRLPNSEISSHLYSTCDEAVQSTLINSFPNFLQLPEDQMLATIEKTVTKRANPAVHRMHFGSLTQHESESVQNFLVRIKTLVIDCEFSCHFILKTNSSEGYTTYHSRLTSSLRPALLKLLTIL